MLISQHTGGVRRRLGKAKARQSKGTMKDESRYVIKVMKVIREGGTFLRVRENQKMYQAFSLGY